MPKPKRRTTSDNERKRDERKRESAEQELRERLRESGVIFQERMGGSEIVPSLMAEQISSFETTTMSSRLSSHTRKDSSPTLETAALSAKRETSFIVTL